MKTKAEIIAHAVAHAADEPDKAEDVLDFFCDEVRLARIPDAVLLRYIAECFMRIRKDGTDANEALNIKRRPGQRERRTLESIDERDSDLAQRVIRRMNGGQLRDDAIEAVAGECGQSVPVVKRAYEVYAPGLRPNKSVLAKAVIGHMDTGAKRDDAIEAVAREHGTSVSIVKSAYKALR